MLESTEQQERITRGAWLVALATLVLGQLHALARFRTEDGRSDLELPLTGVWAEPASRALDPFLGWADADVVYLTYGKFWVPAFAVTILAGLLVQRLRRPTGVEKWGWRVMLGGMSLLAVGAGFFYWGQWTSYNVFDDLGLALTLPGFLVAFLGSTMLGVGLLRRGARPRLAAILLVLAFPGFILISEVTALGNTTLPIMFAMALLASSETRRRAASSSATATPVGSRAATP